MSLLLQALQKAAKSRDGGAAGDQQPGSPPEEGLALDMDVGRQEPAVDDLSLADDVDFEPEQGLETEPELDETPHASAPAVMRRPGPARFDALAASPTSGHAATILRASEVRTAGWIDWVRDRPVHAFAIFAAIFLLFYGGYVYLQIFHPGVLRGNFLTAKPLKATTPPPPPASPISQPMPAPEPPAPSAGAPTPAPAAAAAPPESGAPAGPKAAGATAAPAATAADESEDTADVAPAPPRATAAPRREPRARRAARRQEPEIDVMQDTVAVRQPDSSALANTTLTRAWEALQRGQASQAETLYQQVLQSEPQSIDALLGLAAIAAQRGNVEQATRYYSDALDLEPRNPTAQAGLISILGQADPQLSESRLKNLIAREPSANLYFALGNLYAGQQLWAQAQQAYFQAYQLAPDNPDYAYNLAVGLEHLSQPKIALNFYRKAVELTNLRGHASFDVSRVQDRIGQLTARLGND